MRETDFHPHVAAERGELFECHDGGSTELEYLDLIWALVRTYKPKSILETGALRGFGTSALARACEANKLGHVYSVEIDPRYVNETQDRLKEKNLQGFVTMIEANTLDWLTKVDPWDFTFDFAFFDSDLSIRCKEFRICQDRGLVVSGSLVAFHDTSRLRAWNGVADPHTKIFWDEFQQLLDDGRIKEYIEFPFSRGLVAARVP